MAKKNGKLGKPLGRWVGGRMEKIRGAYDFPEIGEDLGVRLTRELRHYVGGLSGRPGIIRALQRELDKLTLLG